MKDRKIVNKEWRTPTYFFTKKTVKKVLWLYLEEFMDITEISCWMHLPENEIEGILDTTLPYM